ncbi:uncharacterized protein [Choristoneura fumiferana]|uniref:uncharacterized protein n=1 Tax=Choristoneura fumiferana TaxID=7141 RepID=UPI003D15B902
MERVRKAFVVFVFVLSTAFGKDLHTKEKENSLERSLVVNLLNNNDIFTKHERFARHMEVVTETVITHLLQKMKHRHNFKGNKPDTISRMMEDLKLGLKKYVQRKRPHRMANGKSKTQKFKHPQQKPLKK